jgi:hypothetical protein
MLMKTLAAMFLCLFIHPEAYAGDKCLVFFGGAAKADSWANEHLYQIRESILASGSFSDEFEPGERRRGAVRGMMVLTAIKKNGNVAVSWILSGPGECTMTVREDEYPREEAGIHAQEAGELANKFCSAMKTLGMQ